MTVAAHRQIDYQQKLPKKLTPEVKIPESVPGFTPPVLS
jgi:hypothetical protein